jgi:hypothetical protein
MNVIANPVPTETVTTTAAARGGQWQQQQQQQQHNVLVRKSFKDKIMHAILL